MEFKKKERKKERNHDRERDSFWQSLSDAVLPSQERGEWRV